MSQQTHDAPATDTHESKREFIQTYWDSLINGRMDDFAPLVDENCIVHYPGNHFLSGDYHGKQPIIELYTKLYNIGPKTGTFIGECHDIVISDDHAVALIKYDIVLTPGRKISGQAAGVFHIRNHKMVEYWLLERDQKMINDLFSVAGQPSLKKPGSKMAVLPYALMNPLAVVRLLRRVSRQKKGTKTKML